MFIIFIVVNKAFFLIQNKCLKTNHLILYREIITVCSEIHVKHVNTLSGQNVEFFNVDVVVHQVTTCCKQLKREAYIERVWNRIKVCLRKLVREAQEIVFVKGSNI